MERSEPLVERDGSVGVVDLEVLVVEVVGLAAGVDGDVVGANFDPSHMMWMGGDPLASVDMLGDAIFHVHAKDTYINPAVVATTTRLENGSLTDLASQSWWYITLGYGHNEKWWREFCYRLRLAGYDLLNTVMPTDPGDFELQAI